MQNLTGSWQPMPVVHGVPVSNWQAEQYPQDHQDQQQWSLQQGQQNQQMEQPFVIGTWGQPAEPQQQRQQWAAQETYQAWPNDAGKIYLKCLL